jgi:hypothetical protein
MLSTVEVAVLGNARGHRRQWAVYWSCFLAIALVECFTPREVWG